MIATEHDKANINFKKRYVILKNILIIVMFIIFREFMHIFI